MDLPAEQVQMVSLARQNRARELLDSLQRSQHIKQGYSFAKRGIIIIALILFILSVGTSLLKAFLQPSGTTNITTHDLLEDIDRQLQTALKFLQIVAGAGAVKISSLVENNGTLGG